MVYIALRGEILLSILAIALTMINDTKQPQEELDEAAAKSAEALGW